ncbi:MAG: TrkA C-terminal domain-containing protein [Planctomycetota bacterium]
MNVLIERLNDVPLASLMLVVALGYTLGRVNARGIALGPAGGTMLVALLLGSLGLRLEMGAHLGNPVSSIGAFGFALFIYSVGFEAGPRFFSALLGGPGWRFVLVGVLVSVFAVLIAWGSGYFLGLGPNRTAGLLAGGLTSAPTYAAALETVHDVGEDLTPLTLSFVLTYPVGLVGIVLLIQVIPRIRGVDLERAAEAREGAPASVILPRGPEWSRTFEVRKRAVCGIPLEALGLPHRTGCYVTRILRGGNLLAPGAGAHLEPGDHVVARGRIDELRRFAAFVGPEVDDRHIADHMPAPRRVVVQSRGAHGRTLRDLDLTKRFSTIVTAIERGGVVLEPEADLRIGRGDVLQVIGRSADVRRVARELGRLERPTTETDIAVYAGGIFLGLLLGQLRLPGTGFQVTLGYAGGLLISGVLLGRLQHLGPFSTHVPRAARQLVRDLGILLFIAETGVLAGSSSLSGMHGMILPVLAAGALVAVVPVLLAVFVACRFLGLGPIDAWGSVSGGLTSSAALSALQRATGGNASALSYAASYAVASVLATISGQIVVYLLL